MPEPLPSPLSALYQRGDIVIEDNAVLPLRADPSEDIRHAKPPIIREHRAHPRTAVSFPIEYVILSRFRHWAIRSIYRTIPSTERNPTDNLALPALPPWAKPYIPLARLLDKLLFEGGDRGWAEEGCLRSAGALDLSEGGLRLATSSPLWPGTFALLRIPSRMLMAFGYTVLGEVVRVKHTAENEIEAGVAFTAIHESDREGLARFITTPLPQLAAERHPQQSSA